MQVKAVKDFTAQKFPALYFSLNIFFTKQMYETMTAANYKRFQYFKVRALLYLKRKPEKIK